jgi:hypothetical protein
MANTYVKIASVTVGAGGAADIEFTSIPGTYDDLVIKISSRSSTASANDNIQIDFNGSTANRTNRELYGTGSAAGSGTASEMRAGYTSGDTATASTFGNAEIYIPNYAGSTNKSSSADGVSEGNITGQFMAMVANLWSQTSAITSVKIRPAANAATWKQYTSATLYGIKKS